MYGISTDGISRRHRWLTCLLMVTMLTGMLAGFARSAAASPAAGGDVNPELRALYPSLATTPLTKENELAGLTTELIKPGDDAGTTMRQRPFIIGETAVQTTLGKGLPDQPSTFKPTIKADNKVDTEEGGRAALVAFLTLRGVDKKTIDGALKRYDDRATKRIIPAPRLRAAVLMLSGWDPYESTISAILDGKNPTGQPFVGVVYDKLSPLGQEPPIAELDEDPATGLDSIVVDKKYSKELPQVLIPSLVHETLHGGYADSAEEEISAKILNTICWGELLLIQPELAGAGTPLSINNNFELVALLNSTGRAGPEEVGVATSPYGDVLIGIGMEAFDAESIRALMEQIWIYDALLNVGSNGKQTTAALLKRFPGSKALGKTPRYDEAELAVIDSGVHVVITQEKAVKLAAILNLEKTTKFVEGSAKGEVSDSYEETMARRPFVATDPKVFSYGKASTTLKPYTEKKARAVLKAWLTTRGVDPNLTDDVLTQYDSDTTKAQIPDPALRAAALMLKGWDHWDLSYKTIFEGRNPEQVPLQVMYAPKRDSAPVSRRAGSADAPAAIIVNSMLIGESPLLLTSLLVEGTLLHDATLLKEEAISAAAIGTLAWADIIVLEPKAATGRTWGVLQRNLYLLAMLNTKALDGEIGILTQPGDDADVLLGVYQDAVSFTKLIDNEPWGVRFDRSTQLVAPELFVDIVRGAGIEPHTTTNGVIAYGDQTMWDLDATISYYLPPDKIMTVAKAMNLKLAHATNQG